MERYGVAFWGGMPVGDLVDCVRLAEEHGFHSAWLIESYADVFAVLAACAAVTDSIQLGSGVATVFTRHPTTIGVAAGTVDAISQGRFLLGLGVGHREIHVTRDDPEGAIAFEKPRQRLRETAEIVRLVLKSAFEGTSVTYRGEIFTIEGYEPWFEPYRDRVPLYLAALTKGTTELAGEMADGVIPVFYPLERIREVVQQVSVGADRAGRDPSTVDIGCYIPVCVSDDAAQAYTALRYLVSSHIASFRFYQNYFRSTGFVRQVDGVLDAMSTGDRHAAAGWVTDGMVDVVGVGGPADVCRERLEDYRRAGLTLPIIYPVHPEFRQYGPDPLAMAGIGNAIRLLGRG